MTEQVAKEIAQDVGNRKRGVYAKVGSHVTNGVKQYVVHVTHEPPKNPTAERKGAYTIS